MADQDDYDIAELSGVTLMEATADQVLAHVRDSYHHLVDLHLATGPHLDESIAAAGAHLVRLARACRRAGATTTQHG